MSCMSCAKALCAAFRLFDCRACERFCRSLASVLPVEPVAEALEVNVVADEGCADDVAACSSCVKALCAALRVFDCRADARLLRSLTIGLVVELDELEVAVELEPPNNPGSWLCRLAKADCAPCRLPD